MFSAHLADLVNRAAHLLSVPCDTEEVLAHDTAGDTENSANLFLGLVFKEIELDALGLTVGQVIRDNLMDLF